MMKISHHGEGEIAQNIVNPFWYRCQSLFWKNLLAKHVPIQFFHSKVILLASRRMR